jgi:NitT/TauT family transport system ATP-binding protein
MNAYVTVTGGNKIYRSARGDIQALRDIDLTINSGEFLSIVGPSGCGKSTLLRCVAGLETMTSGSVAILGEEIQTPPAELGMVFQRDVLLDWRTVLDNVLLPAAFRGENPKLKAQRATQLLSMFDLQGFERRYPWELSGGMRQRVAICRALLDDPPLLLMDEPFGALDALTRDELNLELQNIWEQSKKTVLFITHGISEAVFLSDRVAVMKKSPGEIVEIIDINLPRPRTLAMRETPEFMAFTRRLRIIFEDLGIFKERTN